MTQRASNSPWPIWSGALHADEIAFVFGQVFVFVFGQVFVFGLGQVFVFGQVSVFDQVFVFGQLFAFVFGQVYICVYFSCITSAVFLMLYCDRFHLCPLTCTLMTSH